MRAMASAKKRQRERNQMAIHIKAVEGKIKDENSSSQIKIILNDFGPKGIGVFSEHSFLIGQEITLLLENPRVISLKGKIAWCKEHDANSNIISPKPFSYRIGIVFQFENEGQEKEVRNFCEVLEKEYLYGVPAYAMPSTHAKAA